MLGTQEEEASRVSLILNNLADTLDDETVNEMEPWQLDLEPETEEEAPSSTGQIRQWQVHNTNANHNSAWANQGDGVKVQWAEIAGEEAFERQRVGILVQTEIRPGTGTDGFSASHVLDHEWDQALAFESDGPVTEDEVSSLAESLEGVVVKRMGASLEACTQVLQRAVQQRLSSAELPEGVAVLDVVWELQRELEWNQRFRQVLLTHLGLYETSSERELLEGLLEEVAFYQKRSSELQRLTRRFQNTTRIALANGVELDVAEPDPADPFAQRLRGLGISTPAHYVHDLVCQSLDQLGV